MADGRKNGKGGFFPVFVLGLLFFGIGFLGAFYVGDIMSYKIFSGRYPTPKVVFEPNVELFGKTIPAEREKPRAQETRLRTAYYVQVAAYAEKKMAEALRSRMAKDRSLPGAQVIKVGRYYAVIVGPYKTYAEALRGLRLVKGMGYRDAFIRKTAGER